LGLSADRVEYLLPGGPDVLVHRAPRLLRIARGRTRPGHTTGLTWTTPRLVRENMAQGLVDELLRLPVSGG
jgi:hypothetical protein